MAEHISSGGKRKDEIHGVASMYTTTDSIAVRITVRDFQHLCDNYGHTVKVDLPGQIYGFLRSQPGCRYSDVLRTPNLADASIVGLFLSEATLDAAIADIKQCTFSLDRLTPPYPAEVHLQSTGPCPRSSSGIK